ncbi:MAG: hypothetical protein ACOX4T_00785 [Acetivibrionales bacterium]|jgi:type IV pilus assembly protein PilQ
MLRKLYTAITALLICSMILPCFMMTHAAAEVQEENISIDMRKADIRDVLSAIAINMGKNIIFTGEPVSISFSIQDVKPKTALDYLLNTAGLDYIEDGSTIIVGSRDTLNKDFYSRLSLTKFVLKYIESDIISAQIDALGIPVKKFVLNSNKHVVFVQGLPKDLSKVNELISMVDKAENVSDEVSARSDLLTQIKLSYISAEQMNDLMQQMGMDPGIIIESNPMALWVYGSKSVINEIKSIQQKVDIAENAISENITLTTVKLNYLTVDEIIPILDQLVTDIQIITFERSLQTIWLSGSDESIKLASNIITKFDTKDHINDNIFFVYKTVNITAQELKKRFDKLDLYNVEINYLNYPEFSRSVIIHCPTDFKLYVLNHINKLDVLSEKIKVPVDYSDIPGGMHRLSERRNLLVNLTGIPATSFTITNNVSRNNEYLYIMYLEETSENIKKVKDYVKYIDDPLLDGVSN